LSSPKEALQPINADSGLPFIDSEEGSEGGDGDLEPSVPRYKTSVVRVEPTELRIFA
uniref:Movement protein n=1 Tax=Anisakis simplex TaxID=6269 RepID=A0A0M3JN53_ANISI